MYQIIVHIRKKKKTVAHQFFQEGSSLLQAVNRMPLVMLIRFLESLCVSQWALQTTILNFPEQLQRVLQVSFYLWLYFTHSTLEYYPCLTFFL